MPRLIVKETLTKEIDIPITALYELVDRLTKKEKLRFLERLQIKEIEFKSFKKEKLESILSDFKTADLYEEDFLKDLKAGLKKSSVYK